MLTLVISLVSAQDRRSQLVARLNAAGLDYRFIDAVLGRTLPASEVRRVAPRLFMPRYARNLTPGEIGCSLSHKLALEAFLETSEPMALILEDDAAVPDNVGAAIAEITPKLPPNWGMLKLGGGGAVRGRLHCQSSFGRIVDSVTPTLDAHAYVVSRSGAEHMLSRLLPIRFPFDVYLRDVHAHHTKIFEVVPNFMKAVDAQGSQIAHERQSSLIRPGVINGAPLAFWRLRHELARRIYVLKRFGLMAAIAPKSLPIFR